jgi:hypothetical protein
MSNRASGSRSILENQTAPAAQKGASQPKTTAPVPVPAPAKK